jgi:hypothetical protein
MQDIEAFYPSSLQLLQLAVETVFLQYCFSPLAQSIRKSASGMGLGTFKLHNHKENMLGDAKYLLFHPTSFELCS